VRATGASIIDHVLGGFPPGLPLVLAGPSGCGRTVLTLQLAGAALARGERVQIVSSEPAHSLTHQADSLGFDLDAALADESLVLLELDASTPALVRAQGAEPLVEALRAEAPGATLVIIDPFTAITAEIIEEPRLREVSRVFVRALAAENLVLTVETARLAQQRGLERVLSELCGAYLQLDREPSGRRTLTVEKSRSGLGAAERVEFSIGPGGTHMVGDATPKQEVTLFTRVRRAERTAPRPAPEVELAAPVGAIEPPPRRPAHRPRHAAATASAGAYEVERPPRDQPVILIVEDSRLQRELLRDWLAPRYDVLTANDGFEALAKVVSHDPDLVILDLIMPRVSGYELLCALRRANMDVPVLVSSSRLATTGDRLGPLVLGATDFLAKPVNRIELEHKVETLLRLRRVRDQRFHGPDAEALFGRVTATRVLEAPEFRERAQRAVSFGEQHGLPSAIATLRADDEAALDAWIATADEDLRFEDAVLRRAKLEALVLLVATGPDDAPKVLERTTTRCADATGSRPELAIELAPAEVWLLLEASAPKGRKPRAKPSS
jgi:DNA-binding response OmpR family regulator/KaiC/GvpD/RAD55 family RecA-like ATPase